MRGSFHMMGPGNVEVAFKCNAVCHILDFTVRQRRLVVRAAFGAELLHGCDTFAKGTLLAQLLHEFEA